MSNHSKHERVRLLRPEPTERGPRFQVGNPGGPGRRPGSANRLSLSLKEAILVAADELGSNGRGKGGLVGYLKFLGQRYPVAFTGLLGKLLPLEVGASLLDAEPARVTFGVEEARRRLAAKGIMVDTIFDPPAEVLTTDVLPPDETKH